MVQWGNFSEEVFDLLQSGVIILDAEGHIVDMNLFAASFLKLEKHIWIGRKVTEIFPDLDMSLAQHPVTEKVSIKIDELFFTLNQQNLMVSAEASPIIVLGKTVGIFLTFQDASESFKIRREIIQSEKMAAIGNMAAGTVHEIRNPLTTIKGFLQLFERDVAKLSGMGLIQKSFSDKCRNIFPLLFSEIQKIEQILSDFLLISKPQELKFKVIRIHDLLNDIMPKLQEQALFYGVSLSCEYPRKNLKFFADPKDLMSALENIVQNSLEAVMQDGEVRLSIETEEEFLRILISDNGCGIPEELIEIVCDPFVTTKPDRSGLGLAISRQVMNRMGGTLSIASKEGEGTKVSLEIPCLHEDILSMDEVRPSLKEMVLR
jgi:two-component system, sporulation sensor kinase E